MCAKGLPQQTLDSVSRDTLSEFFSDADRKARLLRLQHDQSQRTAFEVSALLQYPQKLFLFFQRQKFHALSLSGNVFSALVSSSLEHLASRGRLHSLTEAVDLAPRSLFGLIRSFHDFSKLLVMISVV